MQPSPVSSPHTVFMILISAVRISSKGQVEPGLVIQQPLPLKTNLWASKAARMLRYRRLWDASHVRRGTGEAFYMRCKRPSLISLTSLHFIDEGSHNSLCKQLTWPFLSPSRQEVESYIFMTLVLNFYEVANNKADCWTSYCINGRCYL